VSRWSPKKWTRPRSRAWREAHDPAVDPSLFQKESIKILKRLYALGPTPPTPIMDRPQWAKTAVKFGWLTRGAYLAVKEIPTGRMHPARPGFTEAMFGKSPVLGLIAKTKNWGEP